MKIEEYKRFGQVHAYEMGWAPVGRPVMTVHVFIAGHVMIDTGSRHTRESACRIADQHGVESVLLTHYHEDHAGNAAAVKKRLGIPVFAHPRTCQKMENPARIYPYQHLMWGPAQGLRPSVLPELVMNGRFRFQPIHAPGHSRDHTVFLEPGQGWLFSGDLYLGDRIKYFRADENIAEQISSLRKILKYDFEALFCAHRPAIKDGKKRLARKLDYLENFYGRVGELSAMGLDAKAIMKRLRLREAWLIRVMCFGNVSMENMVRSVMETRGQIRV